MAETPTGTTIKIIVFDPLSLSAKETNY